MEAILDISSAIDVLIEMLAAQRKTVCRLDNRMVRIYSQGNETKNQDWDGFGAIRRVPTGKRDLPYRHRSRLASPVVHVVLPLRSLLGRFFCRGFHPGFESKRVVK
jgi:hypothetical protein